MSSDVVIQLEDIHKSYRTPFRRKKVEAVKGVSFTVKRGEVFGFLGPNGAGKTTTIRILMGLISASSGRASIFGHPLPSREARARLGFLPEAPYFYEYLTVTEMLDLAGRLFGLPGSERKQRANELLELVGLEAARNTPIKKYSKGMMQRAGIAQALINQPDLVVLDEPMSGLDAIGRKDVRAIIESLRDQGRTVFFSSHIMADVEHVCDRVGLLVGGTMRDIGTLAELLSDRIESTDVSFRVPEDMREEEMEALAGTAERVRRRERELRVTLPAEADVDEYLARARKLGAKVLSVTPRHETLEDLFIRRARSGKEAA